MIRHCPLLERDTPTTRLPFAPAPWVLRRCDESGFVFLENPPGYDALHETFAWQTTFKAESAARKQAEPLRYSASQAMKRFRSRVLKRNKVCELAVRELSRAWMDAPQQARDASVATPTDASRINLLDLGCGLGGMLVTVMERLPSDLRARCAPHGVEISTEQARIADATLSQAGGRCVHSDAIHGLTLFEPDFFDVIILSSFLEHEIEPLPLLRNCFTHLRPGGAVIIKVPNFDSVNRTLRGDKWCGFRWPDHVNYFTPSTLRTMAGLARLNVARMNFFDRQPLSDSLYAVLRKA